MPSDFLEKTLETIIVDNYKIISQRGLVLPYRHIDRQFPLPSGKIIDIVNWQVDNNIIRLSVLELKKDAGTEQALWQLLRYVDEITQYLIGWFTDIEVDAVLIGDSISDNIQNLLLISHERLKIYTYQYDFDGIKFTRRDETLDLILELNRRGAKRFDVENIPNRFKFQEKLRSESAVILPVTT